MRAGFLILCVGLYCILQAVGFPFCAPRAYSVFFACRLSVPAFCAYTGRSVFYGRAAFSSFCKRCGSLAAPRTGECGAPHPSLCGTFSPEGAGRIWNRPRATAEHRHGALCFCKGENTGTALRVFARERTRARRSVCLQRERVRALCAAFVHTHGERICARARHSALMQGGKADVVRRARVREQGRFIEAVFFRMAAPQRLFEPEQVAAALGGLA